MNPAVSIIVPVYNTEDYLPRCLDSLSKQTLKGIEILLVIDRNSNEESRKITEDYSKRDIRMKVLNSNAYGASAVRNTGLRYAKGDYIGFVDSDDYVMPEMFSDLYSFVTQHSLDIAVSGILRDNANSQSLQTFMLYPEEITRIPHISRRNFMYKWVLSTQANPVWNKLYRREFLSTHNLFFDETIRMSEDGVFNASCFSLANSAGSMKQAYYVYFNRPGSQMYTINTVDTLRDFQLRWDVFQKCAEHNPDGDSLLAITSLRLIANAMFFFKIRNRPLEEACDFAELLISTLGLQPYLEIALRPEVLPVFAKESHMGKEALENFGKFAESAKNGKEKLLEWQLYFKNVIEKKG
ncbi:glycosyltransferase family 2 protein [Paenibacillus sp. 32352]|uniref:glycosyltransferase family 2 protein n=1 Tax=Paenibacillus sp. 32352 TaxID=1969111 RepID=UPI0015C42188|nr:glycosyltransferase family 2 protein [Paenibacillus sp. 32352]